MIPSKKASHALSRLLRHSLPTSGIPYRTSGYVCVSDILDYFSTHQKRLNLDLMLLVTVVANDEKGRFTLLHAESDEIQEKEKCQVKVYRPSLEEVQRYPLNEWYMRATQGHSFPVPDLMLQRYVLEDGVNQLGSVIAPDWFYHGTYTDTFPLIQATGALLPMKRQHVHLATSLLGIRKDWQICIKVNARKAIENGIVFYQASNGVVLAEEKVPLIFCMIQTRNELDN